MIDLHMHVIPGVDDGARSIAEPLTMLKSAAGQGVTAVIATPHSFALNKMANMNRDLAEKIHDNGFLIQCNVYSFAAEKNAQIRERANMLLQNRLVSFTGSDGHRMNHRPPLYSEGI